MRYEYTYKSRFYQNKLIKMSHAITKTFLKTCMYVYMYIYTYHVMIMTLTTATLLKLVSNVVSFAFSITVLLLKGVHKS